MPGIVDVHHHIMEPKFLELQQARIAASGYAGAELQKWTPSWSIEEMEKAGADVAFLSISTPGSWTGHVEQSRKLARSINDYKAHIVRDHPKRFGFFATLPLPDVEGSLKEIEYALDSLKADGVCLLTNYDGRYPGDPAFAPVYDELNRRKTVVYSHATSTHCCFNIQPSIPPAILEFMFDNTRAIVSLLQSGTFARCPDITFIFSHCGGALAGMAGRIAGWSRSFADKAPGGAIPALKKLNYDTASMNNPFSFAAMMKLAGPEKLMFGSDYPWGTLTASRDPLRALGLSADDLHKIEEGNARRLFARLKG